VCERGDCGGDEVACVEVPSEAPSGVTARIVPPRVPCSQCTACVASAALISLRWRRESIAAVHVQRRCGIIDRRRRGGGRTAGQTQSAALGRNSTAAGASTAGCACLVAGAWAALREAADDEPARCGRGTARESAEGGAAGAACLVQARQWMGVRQTRS
jgi:hypothetical protein